MLLHVELFGSIFNKIHLFQSFEFISIIDEHKLNETGEWLRAKNAKGIEGVAIIPHLLEAKRLADQLREPPPKSECLTDRVSGQSIRY